MVRPIRFLLGMFFCASVLVACGDLQPKIASIPDSIGEFISQRYPALLADPENQPEIYNSAVTDYGVYASPELYGSETVNDYVLYASADDYMLMPQKSEVKDVKPETSESTHSENDYLTVPDYNKSTSGSDFVIVARGDTLYSIAKNNNTTVDELAKINSLKSPYTLSIGQKIQIRSSVPQQKIAVQQSVKAEQKIQPAQKTIQRDVKRVAVQEITVKKGDTLYSLSREYQIPVNDLAVMNKLNAPFTLSVGQKIKVPYIDGGNKTIKSTPIKSEQIAKADDKKTKTVVNTNKQKSEPQTKISSNPAKQLPKISARSSNKFSWPVRGKVLSQYGAKNGGLFNDGINISAQQGTAVRASENGVVAYAGNEVKGMGNLIIIQHSDGWMTVYAHLDSMSVRRGTRVGVGDVIGKIGKTGKVGKPQLHFEIRKGTKAYDPIAYLKK